MSEVLQLELQVEEQKDITLEVERQDGQIELEVDEGTGGSKIQDYNDLINKPTLNGKVLQGDMLEEDPTVPAWAKEKQKPTYTSEEIGSVNREDMITLADIDKMFSQIFG